MDSASKNILILKDIEKDEELSIEELHNQLFSPDEPHKFKENPGRAHSSVENN